MKAVVLVGGEGTRLRPLTYTIPKPLLPIVNVPFLERQLSWLEAGGVREVILSLGYLPEAFRARFPEGRLGGLRLRYAVEDEPLGTAGGIRFAADGIDERFVVCNGDVLTDLDLGAVVAFHESQAAEATIALTRVDDPSHFGVVPTRGDGSVVAFVEKPPPGAAPTHWINAGTYVLEPSVLERIPPRLQASIERETFPRMLERNERLYAFHSDAYWLDIGTPVKYVQAHLDVLRGDLGRCPAPGASERAPGVWCEGDVELDPGALIEPPVLLGAGSRVDAGAYVEASALGPGVTVESRTRVERSSVHAGAHIGTGSVVQRSVLGPSTVVKPDVVVSDETLVGEGATVPAGTRISGGRVPPAGRDPRR